MRNFENKQKIVRASGALKILAGLMIAYYVYSLICAPFLHLFMSRKVLFTGPQNVDFWMMLPIMAMQLGAWINFWIFFRRLHEGHLFDAPTVARLMMAGKWKMAGAIFSCFAGALHSAYDTPAQFAPAMAEAMVSISAHLAGLWTAATIILIAWLLREGQTLEEEQELTV